MIISRRTCFINGSQKKQAQLELLKREREHLSRNVKNLLFHNSSLSNISRCSVSVNKRQYVSYFKGESRLVENGITRSTEAPIATLKNTEKQEVSSEMFTHSKVIIEQLKRDIGTLKESVTNLTTMRQFLAKQLDNTSKKIIGLINSEQSQKREVSKLQRDLRMLRVQNACLLSSKEEMEARLSISSEYSRSSRLNTIEVAATNRSVQTEEEPTLEILSVNEFESESSKSIDPRHKDLNSPLSPTITETNIIPSQYYCDVYSKPNRGATETLPVDTGFTMINLDHAGVANPAAIIAVETIEHVKFSDSPGNERIRDDGNRESTSSITECSNDESNMNWDNLDLDTFFGNHVVSKEIPSAIEENNDMIMVDQVVLDKNTEEGTHTENNSIPVNNIRTTNINTNTYGSEQQKKISVLPHDIDYVTNSVKDSPGADSVSTKTFDVSEFFGSTTFNDGLSFTGSIDNCYETGADVMSPGNPPFSPGNVNENDVLTTERHISYFRNSYH